MRVTGAKINPNLLLVTETTPTSTTETKRIHNIFIIDASGSMRGSRYHNAIAGVNELLKSIKEDKVTTNTTTIVEFEGTNISTRLASHQPIPESYKGMGTDGDTPLNQAIGETLENFVVLREKNFSVEDKVLVNIFTDGGENSSRGKYSNSSVLSELIKKLEGEGFTITFVGTKEEVNYAVSTLNMSLSNTLTHNNSGADILRAFNDTVMSRTSYSKSVAAGEDVRSNFYSKTMQAEDVTAGELLAQTTNKIKTTKKVQKTK